MNFEDPIGMLKKTFADRFPWATLKIVRRNGKLYFYTYGCYKVDSGRLISIFFPNIVMIRGDFANLKYSYRNDE